MPAWWVVKYSPNGRGFLVDMPFSSDLRAERYLDKECDGRGKVIETRSANKKEAAREIRQQMSKMKDGKFEWGKNFKHK